MCIKLNIGGGDIELEGFTTIDRKNGQEAYPLDAEENSVDEIYASHVLEHFSHTQVGAVLHDWVAKLAPGGRIRIAVPDFQWVARNYLDGHPINVQGYTMGGHIDADDYHRAIFDEETLAEAMAFAGLERIGRWQSEIQDCAALECSLNLQGFKPSSDVKTIDKVTAVLSAPRFGPVMHFRVAFDALGRLGIPYQMCQGAYWHQVLSEVIEQQLDMGVEYILTMDYDTVFRAQDILEMYRLIRAFPGVDAIIPVQAKRSSEHSLFGIFGKDGKPLSAVPYAAFCRYLTRVNTGHFGCTLFKADTLREFPRPWFMPTPGDGDRWGKGKVDADIDFWYKWEAAGNSLYMANRVLVGHIQELITWPTYDFTPVYQTTTDYDQVGIPANARRTYDGTHPEAVQEAEAGDSGGTS